MKPFTENITKKPEKCKQEKSSEVKVESGQAKRISRGFLRAQNRNKNVRRIVPKNSLIVAIDLGREEHCAWMCTTEKEPLDKIKISNNPQGIDEMLDRAKEVKKQNNLGKIVIAMEPTGHYWMNVAEYLTQSNYEYVLVHTVSVKREKEIVCYRNAKSDFRDAEAIANLVCERKITYTQLPKNPLWAGLKASAKEYYLTEVNLISEGMRLASFMERVYPDYPSIFKDITKYTALACVLSLDHINGYEQMEFLAYARSHFTNRTSINKMKDFHAMVTSPGQWGCRTYEDGLCMPIKHAADRYKIALDQNEEAAQKLLSYYEQTGYAEYANSFTSLSSISHASVLALIGDPQKYDSNRCILKFAGLDIKENQSGKYKGKTTIAHRGDPLLRYVAYLGGFVLSHHDPLWEEKFLYYTNRTVRPLKKNQAIVAMGCKYLRIIWTLCKNRVYYDPVIAEKGNDYHRTIAR